MAIILVIALLGIPLLIYILSPAPIIKMNGESSVTVEAGDDYTDPGATARRGDEDITDQLAVASDVDTSTLGEYHIEYKVKSKLLLKGGKATRTVIIKDTLPPELTLKGDATMAVVLGDTYDEPGYTAVDKFEGDLSDKVAVEGSVDTAKEGTYKLTYTVADSSGNTSTAERTVEVSKDAIPDGTPPGKIVYLTYDDGPSKYTQALLDVLTSNKVRATFFVTGLNSDYFPLIKKQAEAGQAVALHTYTHNYAEVYASDDAYYADLKRISDLVKEQTGTESKVIRFPGGSSNTVSRKYSSGIMSRLSASTAEKGYFYYDWNVSSGDATNPLPSVQQQVDNIIGGIQRNAAADKSSIVLEHDSKGNEHVAAVAAEVIKWGKANGFYFAPITTSTPVVHQPVAN